MDNTLEEYLRNNIGRACIVENHQGSGVKLKYSGEILDVFEKGYVRIRTIDGEMVCNLAMFQTIKVK